MMKKLINIFLAVTLFFCVSCQKSPSTWENVKTAGRYLKKGVTSLWGKDSDSYWVQNENDFTGPNDEFIPLNDKDLKNSLTTDKAISQPKDLSDSGLPGFKNFKLPTNLYSVFKTIHFDTDDHVIKDKEDLLTLQKIISYLKRHPKTYLCIEGHCDERASAAYNMALGTRRANHIRVLLIKQGLDSNKIYTISYGKEKPIALGHTSNDWRMNRRSEFKIYEKQR